MPDDLIPLPVSEIRSLALRACRTCGASAAMAEALVAASLSAHLAGRPEVGLPHLLDHLDSLLAGRIRGDAMPEISQPAPTMLSVDGGHGIAQLGFDSAFDRLAERAHQLGMALLVQRNIYPAGELGYYVRRLAQAGLLGIAACNAHPLMAANPASGAVFSTNPLAFAAPLPLPRPPLVIDQASSATAFVSILRAEATGSAIPEGWAVDAEGRPTTDPAAARRGALLPAGGYKGANIAPMVEILAAGLSGGNWSLDAGHFLETASPPGATMTVIAIDAEAAAPGFCSRLADQLARLAARGVHVPGSGARPDAATVAVAPAVLAALRARADSHRAS